MARVRKTIKLWFLAEWQYRLLQLLKGHALVEPEIQEKTYGNNQTIVMLFVHKITQKINRAR